MKIQGMRDMTVRWVYPPLDEAMMTVGLEEVETYVLRFNNNVAHYIPTWPILEHVWWRSDSPERR